MLSHEKIECTCWKSQRPDAKETPSDTIAVGPENLNVAYSFPVETEQHELDPDGTRADETDEVPLDDENGGDSETVVRKPLTLSQQGEILEGSSSQPCPTRVRVSSMCSQRACSNTWASSSAAADLSFASAKHLVWTFLRLSLPDGSKNVFCNMVCWGTFYHLCIPFLDKTAGTVAKCIAERWIQYFGPPILIIAEQGKEFVGTQFKEFTNANSTLLHLIDVRAPWQNGQTERHGDIYERIFERARWLHSPSSSVALQRLAMECNAAKNRLSYHYCVLVTR